MKNVLLTILGTIIFLAGAYLMGNYVFDTFKQDVVEQIMSSLYGILLWFVIAAIAVIILGIYEGVRMLGK